MQKTHRALKVTTPNDREIVMTREMDAPRQLVFDAMSKPQLIRRWLWCPEGWEMTVCEEDLRVGGSFRWEWNGPDGKLAMRMTGVYKEFAPPARVARTESFEMGCAVMGDQLVIMELTERDGKTLVTITLKYKSKADRDGALASGMERGMNAGYDNLDDLLASGEFR
ncbi:hypothetical protein RAS1_03050 [Phycisphaerae bacterium RAS1]|nr:hypothetical protein RAS1_03050 [Phycisphaerae bacterium RAS1]